MVASVTGPEHQRRRRSRAVGTKAFRRDIQGLRAFAVIVVILDHLFAWPSGGYVGVDIFFVISGFLITGILLKDSEQTGRLSIATFYKRRIKRIIPASALVLLATLAVAYFVFNTTRFLSTAWDTLYALIFGANWRFAFVGSDYFQADGPISPLRHFWSLSVEEQFYFFWPSLLIATFFIARKLRPRRTLPDRLDAAPVVVLLIVFSLSWAAYETATDPAFAYFSTFSRAWELGIGALLAVFANKLGNIPEQARTALSWAGLLLMIASLFVVSAESPFPFPWALLPVTGAALFIGAGIGGEPRYMQAMTNPLAVYIGNISYSLYLWHFPVIIFMASYFGVDDVPYIVLTLLLIAVTSAGAYHLLEKPVLDSAWLTGRTRPRSAWWHVSRPSHDWLKVLTVFLLAATVSLSAVVLAAEDRSAQDRATAAAATVSPLASLGAADTPDVVAAPPLGKAGLQLRSEIEVALGQTEWPQLNPSIDDVLATDTYPLGIGGCGEPIQQGDCNFGSTDAPRSVYLLGDSVAMKWAGGLLGTFAQGDWKMSVRAMYGCPFNGVDPKIDAKKEQACAERKSSAISEIVSSRPELVLIANTAVMPTLASTNAHATPNAWRDGTANYLQQIAASGSKIAVLSPPPPDQDIKECYSPSASPTRCISRVTSEFKVNVDANQQAVDTSPGAVYLDTRYLFCSESGACPAFAGGMPVKRDLTHPTTEYVEKIRPAFEEMLFASGLI